MDATARALIQRAKTDPTVLKMIATELFPKVFVVTSGSYSDYGIRAAFLDESVAAAWAEKMSAERPPGNTIDGHEVEEWRTVGPEGEEAPGAFWVCMNASGDCQTGPRWDSGSWASKPAVTNDTPNYAPSRVKFYGYGKTQEHALRSANEARRQWLAEHP